MSSVVNSKEGEEPSEEALIVRLRRFVEDSDLSLYQIASLIGISGTILSMWLAGTARPHMTDLDEIEKLLKRWLFSLLIPVRPLLQHRLRLYLSLRSLDFYRMLFRFKEAAVSIRINLGELCAKK
jgi:transcriptional regulator with XRE-family HTH domain